MTMNKKRILKVLLVILLLIACIPFVPPIYNRFTKPLYKNYIDARLWYDKVDCEDLSQVRDYCDRRGYSTDYYILVTRVRDNIQKSKEQKNIQPTKGGHKMVTCQNYVSLFYCQITSCPSDGGIS